MLELRDITKSYRMGENTVYALKGVNIRIEDGEFVAIMGPSGSGKSTLTHILGLLDVPTTGSYLLNGKEISNRTEDELGALDEFAAPEDAARPGRPRSARGSPPE